jgi:hypothetical protein
MMSYQLLVISNILRISHYLLLIFNFPKQHYPFQVHWV